MRHAVLRAAALHLTLAAACSMTGCPESTTALSDGGSLTCSTDRDCSALALVCDRGRGVCVECVSQTDCAADEICLAGDCSARIECTSSRMCPGLVCDPARMYCVQCITADDCEATEMCSDGSCLPLPPPDCVLDTDCGAGMRCTAGACVVIPPDCVIDADCGAGMRCTAGSCVAIPPECVVDGDCGAGMRCAVGRCEPITCAAHADCTDGVFCNGAERCAPGTTGAGADGCRAGTAPCAAAVCDEATDACTSCDADFDGHRAIGCGGDDCDDDDVAVHPGVSEPCDGVDSNCTAGGGSTSEEDADADGFAPNDGTCVGGTIPSTDCDDTDPDVRPTATETCNGIDDDCDAFADEPPAGTECAAGETCFGGSCTATPTGGITAISAGANHVCALSSAGTVYCWGANSYGQLGDGVASGPMAGVPVSGLTDAISIGAGANHTCAVRRGGAVVCWGYASMGQIGDGEIVTDRPTPRAVLGLAGPAVAVTGGAISTCAVLASGDVQCWGESREGQIGDGSFGVGVYRPSPVFVLGLSGVRSISAGYASVCALRTDRTVACWGTNGGGELGDGTTMSRSLPVDAFPATLRADEVAAGYFHTCARHGTTVSCWGNLSGTPFGTVSLSAVGVPGVSDAAEVGSGSLFDCVRRTSGTVSCWGTNTYGELGIGSTGPGTSSPTTPVVGLTDAIRIAVPHSGSFACALRATGAVVCWGANNSGQLGDGTTTDHPTPVTVLGLP